MERDIATYVGASQPIYVTWVCTFADASRCMAGCQAAWIRLWQTTQQVWARLALGFLSVGLMARNNYQITLSSSTSLPVARTHATAEVLIAVAEQPGGGQPR